MSNADLPSRDVDDTSRRLSKRRKLRKGTRSCWACKRRKDKCVFDSTDAICVGCRLRGTECIGQEFAEHNIVPEVAEPSVYQRIGRIEALVEKCVERLDNLTSTGYTMMAGQALDPNLDGVCHQSIGVESIRVQPSETVSEIHLQHRHNATNTRGFRQNYNTDASNVPTKPQLLYTSQTSSGPPCHADDIKTLSKSLYESLPKWDDLEIICRPDVFIMGTFNEFLTMPYSVLRETGCKRPEDMLNIPGSASHPVLIARHLLRLANLLQHFHSDNYKNATSLSESPRTMMERLADTAINLVTTQDRLLGSIEGLECVMLESTYRAKCGNLRLSWMACRRAMFLAQLMGFHNFRSPAKYRMLDPDNNADPQTMWYRIVCLDRRLCLTLGLPQGSTDCNMVVDDHLTQETLLGQLERTQCVISGQILQRNERGARPCDFALAQDLDRQLQKAAVNLPSEWWLPPTLTRTEKDQESLFWDLRRLAAQMFHHTLMHQLYLPFLILPDLEEPKELSTKFCVRAAQEILERFVTLRTFDKTTYSCRAADFQGLMAATTLVMTRLDCYCDVRLDRTLENQHVGDQRMLECALDVMQEVSRLRADTLAAQSADLLHRLLVLEQEAVAEDPAVAKIVKIIPGHTNTRDVSDHDGSRSHERFHIPYLGVIEIAPARDTANSRDSLRPSIQMLQHRDLSVTAAFMQNMTNENALRARVSTHSSCCYGGSETQNSVRSQDDKIEKMPGAVKPTETRSIGGPSDPTTISRGNFFDALLPLPVAGAGDWSFQGLHTAHLDELISRIKYNVGLRGAGRCDKKK